MNKFYCNKNFNIQCNELEFHIIAKPAYKDRLDL